MSADPSERYARALVDAEARLRAAGLGGRRAFAALVRHLAGRLGLPPEAWPEGPDAPAAARLEALPLTAELDLFGLAYERFFPDLFKGAVGQYFTPRPLVELMVDLAGVRPGERVLDPTCGSGGFLVAAHARGADVDGVEVDPDLAALARLNLAVHGAPPRAVVTADVFAHPPEGRWDVVLANPPFSVAVQDPAVLAGYALAEGRASVASDVLFLEAALRWLRPGGRLVTVLPYGVLTNRAAAPVRAWLEGAAVRDAVISLPEGMFRPFGGTQARACVVALRRAPAAARPALAAVVTEPGYDPRSRTYRRTGRDELVALRLFLRGEPADVRARWLDRAGWAPEDALGDGRSSAVPRFRVGDRARVRPRPAPAQGPVTVLDFADTDRATGEVTGTRVAAGGSTSGQPLVPGDVLFGRMRPALGNAVVAGRARDDLPAALEGSAEWIPLVPDAQPEFLLLALRSPFARERLATTSGQTRPRVGADDVLGLELPDPGPAARAALDRLCARAKAERRAWRARLDAAEALYAAFGRGEIDAEALRAAVEALDGE